MYVYVQVNDGERQHSEMGTSKENSRAHSTWTNSNREDLKQMKAETISFKRKMKPGGKQNDKNHSQNIESIGRIGWCSRVVERTEKRICLRNH